MSVIIAEPNHDASKNILFLFLNEIISLGKGSVWSIEEGLKQKTRQNVLVLDWGSRSNAALGNFDVKV